MWVGDSLRGGSHRQGESTDNDQQLLSVFARLGGQR